jgi:hypothetical protein
MVPRMIRGAGLLAIVVTLRSAAFATGGAFELASMSGSESVGITELLMSLKCRR